MGSNKELLVVGVDGVYIFPLWMYGSGGSDIHIIYMICVQVMVTQCCCYSYYYKLFGVAVNLLTICTKLQVENSPCASKLVCFPQIQNDLLLGNPTYCTCFALVLTLIYSDIISCNQHDFVTIYFSTKAKFIIGDINSIFIIDDIDSTWFWC